MLEEYGVPHQTVHKKLILFPNQPYHDDFIDTMSKVFIASRYFGVAGPNKRFWRLWGCIMLTLLMVIVFGAIYKLGKLLTGLTYYSVGNRSVTARLSGSIFYTASFVSLILSWKLSSAWESISTEWVSAEKNLSSSVPRDTNLKRRMVLAAIFLAFGAFVEHILSIIAAIELDTPRSMLLQEYILTSHGFILVPTDYTIWIALPILFMSNVATILWNFQDVLIILLSMGLTSRYHRLNQWVAKLRENFHEKHNSNLCKHSESLKVYNWRKIREAFVKQALLVRRVDSAIGGLILLSSSGNFYFICLQLFLGITQGISGATIKRLYYLISLSWVCLRFFFVVLAAADVNVHSKKAIRYLHECNEQCYNIEIERLLKQLTKDYIALSGLGFFYIDRGLLLQMAASIITYELVLIQFDGKTAGGSSNIV